MVRISALGIVLASLFAAGCGGSSGGSCDVNALFTTKYGCDGSGCHDTVTKAANFDMKTPGLESRLVDVAPPGGGPTFTTDAGVTTPITALQSMCTGMGMHYLDKGSVPATGLFMRKLTANPGCGTRMPQTSLPTFVVSDGDLACIQSWANNLTKP
jgi:hypothetical protein